MNNLWYPVHPKWILTITIRSIAWIWCAFPPQDVIFFRAFLFLSLFLLKLSASFLFSLCGLEAPGALGVQEDKSNACHLRQYLAASTPCFASNDHVQSRQCQEPREEGEEANLPQALEVCPRGWEMAAQDLTPKAPSSPPVLCKQEKIWENLTPRCCQLMKGVRTWYRACDRRGEMRVARQCSQPPTAIWQ